MGSTGSVLRAVCGALLCSIVVNGCGCELLQDDLGCASDRDCPVNAVCNAATCTAIECRSDEACGLGSVCTVAFQCVAGCRYDRDCRHGLSCNANDEGPKTCGPGPECVVDADCKDGRVCDGEECESGCRTSFDCPPHAYCMISKSSGFVSIGTFECQSGCHEDGECAAREICDAGTCHESCATEADCTEDSLCILMTAFASVSRDSRGAPRPCAPGRRCMCVPRGASDRGAPDAGTLDAGAPDAERGSGEAGAGEGGMQIDASPDAHSSARDGSTSPGGASDGATSTDGGRR